MIRVIGVRFRTAGRIYFFDPLNFDIKKGDPVIVETARGIEYGTAVADITDVEDDKVIQPLKPVIRIANSRDTEQEAGNREKEREAFRICGEKIREHGLAMKLVEAEYTFDNSKVLFYFTADGRIDFRELVKDLAGVFRTRIELRQIGVRDETKMMGGIGTCGRPLCCHSYLSDFIPVSIKMAKEQNLSLNPSKISGVCGRLMCCLKNEEETYEELNRRLPGIGDTVTMENGVRGEVQSVNVLRQLVKVIIDDGDEKEIKEFPVEQLRFRRRHTKKEKMELSKEELEELERLEEEEQQELESSARKESGQRQGAKNRQEKSRQDNRNSYGGRQEEPLLGEQSGAGMQGRNAQRSDGGPKSGGHRQQRQGTGRQPGQRHQTGGQPEGERQPEDRFPKEAQRSEAARGEGRSRQDGKRRQHQNNGDRQGPANHRYQGRNRHDSRGSQEESEKSNGSQA